MNQELKNTMSQTHAMVRNMVIGKSNELLPVKYDPFFQWLKDIEEISKSPLYVMPPKEVIEDELKSISTSDDGQFQSGIIEDLNRLLITIQEDMERTFHPTSTTSFKENKMIQRDTEDFYSRRIPMYCNRIADHISGLIHYDNYPSNVFGDYNSLARRVQTVTNDDERLRVLEQMKILARSVIPFSVKYQDETVIDSNSLSVNSITEG